MNAKSRHVSSTVSTDTPAPWSETRASTPRRVRVGIFSSGKVARIPILFITAYKRQETSRKFARMSLKSEANPARLTIEGFGEFQVASVADRDLTRRGVSTNQQKEVYE